MRQITSWDLGAQVEWSGWDPGTGAAEADRIVAQLATTPPARDRVRLAVTAADRASSEPACVLVALWVPDATTGEPLADLTATLIGTEPGQVLDADEIAAGFARPSRTPGAKVLHHDTARTEVDAGAAVVVTRTVATRATRQVLVTVEWTVVPPDSADGMQLVFSTPYSAIAERMADESVAIVNALRLETGE